MNLTEDQLLAIQTKERYLRILAGPGSGKTRVVVERIAHLVQNGISPYDVCAITFTRKAAEEMQRRLAGHPMVGRATRKMFVGTAHSLAAHVVRTNAERIGYDPSFTIYDEQDEADILAVCLADFPRLKAKEVRGALARHLAHNEPLPGGGIDRVCSSFLERLHTQNALTFDLLLFYAIQILRERPASLAAIPHRWLFYDEVQDFNIYDYRLIQVLQPEHLVVVGDLNQNIYAFRGTSPHWLLGMDRDWRGLFTIHMIDNWRSVERIVDAANNLISHNTKIVDAGQEVHDFWMPSIRAHRGGGVLITAEHQTCSAEAGNIAWRVGAMLRDGQWQPRDIAVLTRTHRQHALLAAALEEAHVPHRVIGKHSIFQRDTVRRIIYAMRLAFNRRDDQAVRMLAAWPQGTLRKENLHQVRLEALRHGTCMLNCIERDTVTALGLLATRIDALQEHLDQTPVLFVNLVLAQFDVIATLAALGLVGRQKDAAAFVAWIERWQQERFEQHGDLRPTLQDLLEVIAFHTQQDEIRDDLDAVRICTMHAAKGLEWPVVFVAGIEEGLMPLKSAPLDEERRLFYVAITRAKEALYITHASKRSGWDGTVQPCKPSRFLAEIKEALPCNRRS